MIISSSWQTEWSADMRESTSYKLIIKVGEGGRLKIISGQVAGLQMDDAPMHRVVSELPDGDVAYDEDAGTSN
jgi:hypothetical protein